MRSAGKTPGKASPAFTLSAKCIASTNSSQDNLPSPSMSDRDLAKKKKHNRLCTTM